MVRDHAVSRAVFVWLVAIVLAHTLVPIGHGEGGISLGVPRNAGEIMGNFLLLLPLGAAVAVRRPAGSGWRRPLLSAVGLLAAMSCGIEIAQLALPGRYFEPWDILLNTTGAAAGAGAALALRRRGMDGGALVTGVVFVTWAGVFGLLAGTAMLSMRLLRIDQWDPAFAITAGQEATGERQYIGDVRGTRVCAGDADVVCLAAGAERSARNRLVTLAERSQRAALHGVVTSGSDAQVGPARIVSFSRDTEFRNITLAQDGRTLVLRVRSALAGGNGDRAEFHLPDAVAAGESTAISVRYSPRSIEITAIRGTTVERGRFATGLLVGWWLLSRPSIQPGGLDAAAAVAAAGLFVPVGMLVGAFLGGIGRLRLLGVIALVSGTSTVTIEWLLGSDIEPTHVLLAVLAAIAGAMSALRERPFATRGPVLDRAARRNEPPMHTREPDRVRR